MKLRADISGIMHDVELTRTGDNVHAVVDGREYTLDVLRPEPNVYSFRSGAAVTEVFVSPGSSNVSIGGRDLEIEIIDPKRLRGSSAAGGEADGAAEIKTAMPGKVVRILVAAGDEVQKGDGVLVVEAMKMQSEMKAPKDGIVKEIRTSEGSTVNAGDVLAVIE